MLHSICSIIYLYAGIAGIYYNSSFIKYIYLTGRVGVFGLMGISICHLLLMLCVSAERKSNSKRENERAHLTTSLNWSFHIIIFYDSAFKISNCKAKCCWHFIHQRAQSTTNRIDYQVMKLKYALAKITPSRQKELFFVHLHTNWSLTSLQFHRSTNQRLMVSGFN